MIVIPSPISQVIGIAATDLRLRLRRPATLWLILVLSGLAYLLIPDPATGRALMVVDGARALYTSQVVALATAGLASLLLTFSGFYLTSNTIRRDLLARTGGIIAATPVSSGTYLVGKWLGGAAYLALITAMYVLNVMAMHLLRGEGPLEPVTYLITYLLALGPAIVVVSALALMFECVPPLAGRLGDVLYFFVWSVLLALGAMGQGGGAGRYMDVMGLGFILGQVHSVSNSQQLAIGMTPFRGGVAPWVLPPIPLTFAILLPRVTAALLAVPLLFIARLFFHRFDPARVRSGRTGSGDGLIRRLSVILKPVTRTVSAVGARLVPAVPGVVRPIVAETVMTLCQSPLVLLAWFAVVIATIIAPSETVRHILPLLVALMLAIALADLSTRDRAAGVQAMLYSMPRIKPDYAFDQARRGSAAGPALLCSARPEDRLQRTGIGALARHCGGIHGRTRDSARIPYPHTKGLYGRLHALPVSGAQWRPGSGPRFRGLEWSCDRIDTSGVYDRGFAARVDCRRKASLGPGPRGLTAAGAWRSEAQEIALVASDADSAYSRHRSNFLRTILVTVFIPSWRCCMRNTAYRVSLLAALAVAACQDSPVPTAENAPAASAALVKSSPALTGSPTERAEQIVSRVNARLAGRRQHRPAR